MGSGGCNKGLRNLGKYRQGLHGAAVGGQAGQSMHGQQTRMGFLNETQDNGDRDIGMTDSTAACCSRRAIRPNLLEAVGDLDDL